MKYSKLILLSTAATGLVALCDPASAATCTHTALTVKDANALTDTVPYAEPGDGSGNCVPEVYVFNGSALGAHNTANSPTVNLSTDLACPNHGFKHITSTTDTVAVQGVSGQTVYLCSWKARGAGVETWFWENTASVNNNCSSTNTQISGAAPEIASSGESVNLPLGTFLSNTSGNGLCINSVGTGGVDIDYWYKQL